MRASKRRKRDREGTDLNLNRRRLRIAVRNVDRELILVSKCLQILNFLELDFVSLDVHL